MCLLRYTWCQLHLFSLLQRTSLGGANTREGSYSPLQIPPLSMQEFLTSKAKNMLHASTQITMAKEKKKTQKM